jgi:hypothetical protein
MKASRLPGFANTGMVQPTTRKIEKVPPKRTWLAEWLARAKLSSH